MPTRKTTTAPQTTAQQYSPNDLAYWMGRVDAGLLEMKGIFEQYMRTNEQNWSDERSWRTCVDKALSALDKRLSILEEHISQQDVMIKSGQDAASDADQVEDIAEKAITWKWVVEKLGVPVLTALILWLMLTLFPKLIQMLPQ